MPSSELDFILPAASPARPSGKVTGKRAAPESSSIVAGGSPARPQAESAAAVTAAKEEKTQKSRENKILAAVKALPAPGTQSLFYPAETVLQHLKGPGGPISAAGLRLASDGADERRAEVFRLAALALDAQPSVWSRTAGVVRELLEKGRAEAEEVAAAAQASFLAELPPPQRSAEQRALEGALATLRRTAGAELEKTMRTAVPLWNMGLHGPPDDVVRVAAEAAELGERAAADMRAKATAYEAAVERSAAENDALPVHALLHDVSSVKGANKAGAARLSTAAGRIEDAAARAKAGVYAVMGKPKASASLLSGTARAEYEGFFVTLAAFADAVAPLAAGPLAASPSPALTELAGGAATAPVKPTGDVRSPEELARLGEAARSSDEALLISLGQLGLTLEEEEEEKGESRQSLRGVRASALAAINAFIAVEAEASSIGPGSAGTGSLLQGAEREGDKQLLTPYGSFVTRTYSTERYDLLSRAGKQKLVDAFAELEEADTAAAKADAVRALATRTEACVSAHEGLKTALRELVTRTAAAKAEAASSACSSSDVTLKDAASVRYCARVRVPSDEAWHISAAISRLVELARAYKYALQTAADFTQPATQPGFYEPGQTVRFRLQRTELEQKAWNASYALLAHAGGLMRAGLWPLALAEPAVRRNDDAFALYTSQEGLVQAAKAGVNAAGEFCPEAAVESRAIEAAVGAYRERLAAVSARQAGAKVRAGADQDERDRASLSSFLAYTCAVIRAGLWPFVHADVARDAAVTDALSENSTSSAQLRSARRALMKRASAAAAAPKGEEAGDDASTVESEGEGAVAYSVEAALGDFARAAYALPDYEEGPRDARLTEQTYAALRMMQASKLSELAQPLAACTRLRRALPDFAPSMKVGSFNSVAYEYAILARVTSPYIDISFAPNANVALTGQPLAARAPPAPGKVEEPVVAAIREVFTRARTAAGLHASRPPVGSSPAPASTSTAPVSVSLLGLQALPGSVRVSFTYAISSKRKSLVTAATEGHLSDRFGSTLSFHTVGDIGAVWRTMGGSKAGKAAKEARVHAAAVKAQAREATRAGRKARKQEDRAAELQTWAEAEPATPKSAQELYEEEVRDALLAANGGTRKVSDSKLARLLRQAWESLEEQEQEEYGKEARAMTATLAAWKADKPRAALQRPAAAAKPRTKKAKGKAAKAKAAPARITVDEEEDEEAVPTFTPLPAKAAKAPSAPRVGSKASKARVIDDEEEEEAPARPAKRSKASLAPVEAAPARKPAQGPSVSNAPAERTAYSFITETAQAASSNLASVLMRGIKSLVPDQRTAAAAAGTKRGASSPGVRSLDAVFAGTLAASQTSTDSGSSSKRRKGGRSAAVAEEGEEEGERAGVALRLETAGGRGKGRK